MLAVKSMYMEEQPVVKPHRLTMQNRSTIQVTGVSDVIAYDPGEIILETSAGLLLIKGAELHMNHLSLEKGETGVDGRVDIPKPMAVQGRPEAFSGGFLNNHESGCSVSGKAFWNGCPVGFRIDAGL